MKYVECPEEYGDGGNKVTVFMAGGITGCPDWQAEMRVLLSDTDLVLLNPRRANFPIEDPYAATDQIVWEREHLYRADRILFWFPAVNNAGCPIALLELGYWLHSDKPLAVGVEPGYVREDDVCIQTDLARPDVYVVDSLRALADEIR